ncbi:hypothetical protein B1R32_103240 [Abditibacterium utsteinense]|uniref:Tetratricopeptide repeat-containing protein n=1 Tax=Abditibacterium utsteinense TaxID=1960156 RepID=A0A2S8SVZ9_9BACT|nr:tetratricopeptide repeat protein [Abditibacterium utsteinense]PQV64970.1 hypothetical protein B1R32_103240 [Abditibacterium utsteinense]
MLRHFFNAVIAATCALAFLFLLRLTLSPDPAQSLFLRAQQLEAAGQIPLSLRAYALISDKHPESFYAPRALLRQGDILAAQGTRSDDKALFRGAVAAYLRLASAYPSDALATEALLDAGKISAENLGDRVSAKRSYALLLQKSGAKSDAAAVATLKLGRIALDEGDKNSAQTLLQSVLQKWPRFENRGAEAQFFLGVAYETLFNNKEWATRAYDATIARYPNSTWASDARQKLGLLVFSDTRGRRPARRVLINIDALPDDGNSNGSLWSALRVVLAARGVEASEADLDGWSLMPFYAGLDPKNPARVIDAPFDAWENVVANAGLRFSVEKGGKEEKALRFLQDEIDAARAPLVYFEENGAKTWALCIGYDSERGEVMLQRRGARFDTLSAKSFAAMWKAKSSFGEPFTLISLVPADQKTPPTPNLTPTPAPRAAPGVLAAPNLQNAPTFVWELPKISAKNTDIRARKRGAAILQRGRDGQVLLGASALDFLARELNRIARAPNQTEETPEESLESVGSTVLSTPAPAENVTPIPEANPENGESPYAPEATATPLPTPAPRRAATLPRRVLREDGARARSFLQFLGEPARHWAATRREAAQWCDEAAHRGKNDNLKRAAEQFRQSASALEAAISLAPAAVSDIPGVGDRNQIGEVAHQIERARDAERQAARALAI